MSARGPMCIRIARVYSQRCLCLVCGKQKFSYEPTYARRGTANGDLRSKLNLAESPLVANLQCIGVLFYSFWSSVASRMKCFCCQFGHCKYFKRAVVHCRRQHAARRWISTKEHAQRARKLAFRRQQRRDAEEAVQDRFKLI